MTGVRPKITIKGDVTRCMGHVVGVLERQRVRVVRYSTGTW